MPVCALILGGCFAASGPPAGSAFTAEEAIAKTVREKGRTDFPEKAGKIEGMIKGGGPYPGIRVPGTFESAAIKQSGSVYLVTLTETWDAKDFRAEGAAPAGKLTYFWRYEVSPDEVKPVSQGGDFPPDHVE